MSFREKLIIFAKAPVAGQVKTRLVPPLTPEEACRLYRSWAVDTYAAALFLGGVAPEVAYQAHPDFPNPDWMAQGRGQVPFFYQAAGDLGAKLADAFDRAFKPRCERAAAIGTDSPGLPAEYIREGFERLKDHDLVLGPAQDGGYYLIGLRQKAVPELFEGISWSTPDVLAGTMKAAENLGLSVWLLPEYFDVDRPEDLKKIKAAGVN